MMKPEWLQNWQAQKAELFRLEGFPTRKTEDWKYTNVGIIAEYLKARNRDPQELGEGTEALLQLSRTGVEEAYRLLILDGQFQREHSVLPDHNLVSISRWSEQYAANPGWLKTLWAEFSNAKATPFTNLNQANFEDGLIIKIKDDCVLDKPIQLVYINTHQDEGQEQHLYHLLEIGKKAQATFLETHEGRHLKSNFHNHVTHIRVAENARLDYFKCSPDNESALQISSMAFVQQKNSLVNAYHFGLGGRLVRDDLHFILKDTGASCCLYGFYALKGAEHYDCHSRIDHASSATNSVQLYKGIIDEKARGVFNGKIIVHKGLAKVSAKQRNNNLLLTKTAEMNTKPELEIYSEDVSCAHGATIGELDSKALFYLRSRGIPEEEAKQVLTHAFAAEVLEKLPLSHQQGSEYLHKRIRQKLFGFENRGESRD